MQNWSMTCSKSAFSVSSFSTLSGARLVFSPLKGVLRASANTCHTLGMPKPHKYFVVILCASKQSAWMTNNTSAINLKGWNLTVEQPSSSYSFWQHSQIELHLCRIYTGNVKPLAHLRADNNIKEYSRNSLKTWTPCNKITTGTDLQVYSNCWKVIRIKVQCDNSSYF